MDRDHYPNARELPYHPTYDNLDRFLRKRSGRDVVDIDERRIPWFRYSLIAIRDTEDPTVIRVVDRWWNHYSTRTIAESAYVTWHGPDRFQVSSLGAYPGCYIQAIRYRIERFIPRNVHIWYRSNRRWFLMDENGMLIPFHDGMEMTRSADGWLHPGSVPITVDIDTPLDYVVNNLHYVWRCGACSHLSWSAVSKEIRHRHYREHILAGEYTDDMLRRARHWRRASNMPLYGEWRYPLQLWAKSLVTGGTW